MSEYSAQLESLALRQLFYLCGSVVGVGGKTGTAQVYSDKSDNGVMAAFAPFEKPEIAITCVIEQGSGGTEAGYSVRDVFDYYFKIGKWAPVEETPEETTETDETTDEASYDDEIYYE